MSKLKYALAIVAAGGAAGAASTAGAATTYTFDADAFGNTPINLAGASTADAQYTYGKVDYATGGLTANGSALIGSDSTTQMWPTAGETFTGGTYETEYGPFYNASENYLHLKFEEDGQTYIGFADIAGDNDPTGVDPVTLKSVTFEAVPEPATWGLMISGLGMMGAALRRQRRLKAQPALA